MTGPRWLGLAAAALLLALVAVGAVAVAGGCAWSSTTPGGPTVCEQRVAPMQAVVLGLGVAAGAGVALRRAWAAWPPALLMLGITILFGFSLGNLIPLAAGVVALVAAWQLVAARFTSAA